jgi:hypothetical protein
MPNGLSFAFSLNGFPHCVCSDSISGGGGEGRAVESEMSDEEDAMDETVFECDRAIETVRESSAGPGIGMESMRSWASLNVSDRKGLRSSTGIVEKSMGDKVLSASWRAAIAAFDGLASPRIAKVVQAGVLDYISRVNKLQTTNIGKSKINSKRSFYKHNE